MEESMSSDDKLKKYSELFQQGEGWLYRNGRYLDVARWNYHFHKADPSEVYRALQAYQNPDGGFGHRLEADIQSPASTPIATWSALRILRELQFPAEAMDLIRGCFEYLDTTVAFNGKLWTASSRGVGEAPHAPWWNYSESNAGFGYNPTAEFLGLIFRFDEAGSALRTKAEGIFCEMIQKVYQTPYEMSDHELSCFVMLAGDLQTSGQGESLPAGFSAFLAETVDRVLSRDKDSYSPDNYYTSPDFYINSKASPYYRNNAAICHDYAQYLIHSFHPAGYWPLNWTWGAEAVPPDSKRDWQGTKLVNNTLYLKNIYLEP